MALEVLLGFSDGYVANNNNYYVYYSPKDEQFIYIPSDVDLSLGSTMVRLRHMWSGDYRIYPGFSLFRPLLRFIEVPEFKKRFESLLLKFCNEVIHPDIINPRIDAVVDMIKEDVEWDKTLPRVNAVRKVEIFTPSIILPRPLSIKRFADLLLRPIYKFSLDEAVNGNDLSISLSGVKQWFQRQTEATLKHFDENLTAFRCQSC